MVSVRIPDCRLLVKTLLLLHIRATTQRSFSYAEVNRQRLSRGTLICRSYVSPTRRRNSYRSQDHVHHLSNKLSLGDFGGILRAGGVMSLMYGLVQSWVMDQERVVAAKGGESVLAQESSKLNRLLRQGRGMGTGGEDGDCSYSQHRGNNNAAQFPSQSANAYWPGVWRAAYSVPWRPRPPRHAQPKYERY